MLFLSTTSITCSCSMSVLLLMIGDHGVAFVISAAMLAIIGSIMKTEQMTF